MEAKFDDFPTAEHDEAHAERLSRLISAQRTQAVGEKEASKAADTKPARKKPDPDDGLTQSERFIKAARELATDDDPERFKERVRKLAGTKAGKPQSET